MGQEGGWIWEEYRGGGEYDQNMYKILNELKVYF